MEKNDAIRNPSQAIGYPLKTLTYSSLHVHTKALLLMTMSAWISWWCCTCWPSVKSFINYTLMLPKAPWASWRVTWHQKMLVHYCKAIGLSPYIQFKSNQKSPAVLANSLQSFLERFFRFRWLKNNQRRHSGFISRTFANLKNENLKKLKHSSRTTTKKRSPTANIWNKNHIR